MAPKNATPPANSVYEAMSQALSETSSEDDKDTEVVNSAHEAGRVQLNPFEQFIHCKGGMQGFCRWISLEAARLLGGAWQTMDVEHVGLAFFDQGALNEDLFTDDLDYHFLKDAITRAQEGAM